MKLTFNPKDLKDEFLDKNNGPVVPTSSIRCMHLSDKALGALSAVGRGVYTDWNGVYNAMYPTDFQ